MPDYIGQFREMIEQVIAKYLPAGFDSDFIFYGVALIAAGYCCLEGIGIYKMLLSFLSFLAGYNMAGQTMMHLAPTLEMRGAIQAGTGIACAALAYRYVMAGVFLSVYNFGTQYLPDYFGNLWSQLFSLFGGGVLGFLSRKSRRLVVVIVTAVVGGFSMVYYFQKLMKVFPYAIPNLPPASSPIWLYASIFLSAAGAAIQGLSTYNVENPGFFRQS